jgi:threonine dehydratase
MTGRRIAPHDIEVAAGVIDPVFLNSPQFVCDPLSAVLGVEVVVKVETLNPIRSFKGRGADYFMHRHVTNGGGPVVCASAGNFGQGMAYAARTHGVPLVVFASPSANPLKIERMRTLGADVRLEGRDFDAAKVAARAFAEDSGMRFVEDSRDIAPTIGAGTIGRELMQDDATDTVLVPLGNGALLAGVGCWVKHMRPSTRVVGVCAAGAPAMEESWRQSKVITHDRIDTIADGIGVRIPVPEALQDIRLVTDEIVLVDDDQIIAAMRLIHQHVGLVVEPSGAVGIAALHVHSHLRHGRVAVVLCGGNLTPQQVSSWLS